MEKNKKIGIESLKKICLDIDGIFKDFELDGQKELSLYVGGNGTGKTLVLIFKWILGSIANIYLMSGKSMEEYEKILQYFFNYSFEKNDFTGKIKAEFENMEISFELEIGEVKNLNIKILDPSIVLESTGMPIFISKTTRLFTDIVTYLKVKKMMGILDLENTTEEIANNLANTYRLYDILFIERMISRLKDPNFKINEYAKKSFKETINKEIVNVTYNEDECSFTIHEIKDGKEITYPATMMSSGEQAWVNMFIQM